MAPKKIALIGYSGHAYTVADIILKSNRQLLGYFEQQEKLFNPFALPYLGDERNPENSKILRDNEYFVAIGNNGSRKNIIQFLVDAGHAPPATIIHPRAIIGEKVILNAGTMVAAGAVINPLAHIGQGVICNTSSIIEHECRIGDYAHIGPGAVLNGNVSLGEESFIGANAVIKQGVKIGNRVIIGAGAVVLKDIDNDEIIVGNPGKPYIQK